MLHLDPRICAQMHVDKHVIKLILESAQMLCDVWHITDPDNDIYVPQYKLAHKPIRVLYGIVTTSTTLAKR